MDTGTLIKATILKSINPIARFVMKKYLKLLTILLAISFSIACGGSSAGVAPTDSSTSSAGANNENTQSMVTSPHTFNNLEFTSMSYFQKTLLNTYAITWFYPSQWTIERGNDDNDKFPSADEEMEITDFHANVTLSDTGYSWIGSGLFSFHVPSLDLETTYNSINSLPPEQSGYFSRFVHELGFLATGQQYRIIGGTINSDGLYNVSIEIDLDDNQLKNSFTLELADVTDEHIETLLHILRTPQISL